ncbi:YobA family protein [Virgibacillus flavescens]|uniref:YobA family protein n=1 Tax=Virgibacillus flavescens TaxID=1611422 RepID=UPI003D337538
MKHILMLIVSVMFVLSGCSGEEQEFSGKPTIEGYLVDVQDKSILVVSGITKEQAVNMTWNDLTQGNDKIYKAHTFYIDDSSTTFVEFKKGQKVRVWGKGGVRESFPPQSDLGKIELVE